jgi:serine/threonine-protein kinase RsbW
MIGRGGRPGAHAGAAREAKRRLPIVRSRWRARGGAGRAASHEACAELQLVLPARPESIATVRSAVRERGEALGVEESQLADICLAVTEACTNVVLHAYPEDRPGPLWVTLTAEPSDAAPRVLTLLVRDSGRGLHGGPRPASGPAEEERPDPQRAEREEIGLGLGLKLMRGLASDLSIERDARSHTQVRMIFQIRADRERDLVAPATIPPSKRRQAGPGEGGSRDSGSRRMKVRSGAQ